MNQPLLILISGLPGTGKSTLAESLAERIGAVALSRDQARQAIGGPLDVLDRGFTGLLGRYRRGLQEEANRRLEKAVADELVAGRSVIVEVVADRDIRRQLHELTEDHGAAIRSIEVTCSDPAELARRLSGRPCDWNQLVARMSKSYEPSPSAFVVDSCMTPDEMVKQVVRFVCRET